MSTARDRILTSVRAGLVKAVLPDSSPSAPLRPETPAPTGSLVDTFTAALEGLKGHVHRAATPAEAASTVLALARQYAVREYISWDDEALGIPGIRAALTEAGITRLAGAVDADPVVRAIALERLATLTMGITGADAALADTGALVLATGPGRGRLPSLLPPVHVAVLPVTALVPNLGTLLARRPGIFDEASNVVVIAGPSRTADIEMTLTHGVHGPRYVHAILVG